MKTTKMSLANLQGKLSRAEMKNIMAGSGDVGKCGDHCYSKESCKDSTCPKCISKNGGPYICVSS